MRCCHTWFEDTGLTKKCCHRLAVVWRLNPYDSEIAGFCIQHDRWIGIIGRYTSYEDAQLELLKRSL